MHPPAIEPDASPRLSQIAGWTLLEFGVVDSTNLVAGKLGAWHAVRADTQTAGRGRFQRTWVSDAGGLWLSAVVPTGPDREPWQALPLVAGLALIESLLGFGVCSSRLRWPNDVMVGERKLAGLLVDRFSPHLAVIGVGVNVANDPAACDPALKGATTRLADLVPEPHSLAELTAAFLVALRSVVEPFAKSGLGSLLGRINDLWGAPHRVTIDLDGVQRSGLFTGVDDSGRLLLEDDLQRIIRFEPQQVKLLREN